MTDPSTAPDEQEHTLPSGLKVTIRSHRTLRRTDIHQVWSAGNKAAAEHLSAAAQHDALMSLLVVSTSDPGAYPVPMTPDVLERLQGADYIALFDLVDNGFRLANGLSVVPNPDDWADPTRPKPESSDSSPDSTASPSSPSTETTGTTSTTTTTSTTPEAGQPAS